MLQRERLSCIVLTVGHGGCSLDTGRLNPETYRLFDKVEKHYGIRIEYTFPDARETMDLVREKGMFSFYEDGHQECCRVRKVGLPLHPSACMRPAAKSLGPFFINFQADIVSAT